MQILKESFTISIERQKMILKNKITSLKYNTELDINMFITDLQNKISQYEKIDTNMSNSTKVGILNRSLPENIRWINVFQYVDNWKQCCQYVKKVIPEIVFSNFKEQNILNTINDNNNILLTQNNNKIIRKNKIKIQKQSYTRNDAMESVTTVERKVIIITNANLKTIIKRESPQRSILEITINIKIIIQIKILIKIIIKNILI